MRSLSLLHALFGARSLSLLHALFGARSLSLLHALFGARSFQFPALDAASLCAASAMLREYAAPESYPNGPGWTCAHVKRMALKARNRARHKAAVRRAPR